MDRNSKLINFIKAVIIIVTAVIIVVGTSRILLLKSEDGINQFQAFYEQPENSIDVIFSGSSKVYCDISTGVLWDNYGIAAFDLGGAEAPSWVSYYQLKEALKTQRPKVICYEVSVSAMYDMLTQANNWASDNSYGMKWNNNRIDLIRINSEEGEFYSRLNPFNIMHGRYKDLAENDFTNVRKTANYKGFDPRENVYTTDVPQTEQMTGEEPCTEKEEEYIRKLIKLTKEEEIPIILFASPYAVTEHEQNILNYVGSIAASEGVEFIDFNRRYDEIGMDFSVDMADSGHLNYNGNYKFSDYFGSILKEKYDIPDHRGDARYTSWDWDSSLQKYERNDLDIVNSDNAMDVLSKTQTGYVVFAVNEGKVTVVDNGQIVAQSDENFRIAYRTNGDSFVFEERAGQSEDNREHICSLHVNDKEYKEKFDNLLFVYDSVRHEFVRTVSF